MKAERFKIQERAWALINTSLIAYFSLEDLQNGHRLQLISFFFAEDDWQNSAAFWIVQLPKSLSQLETLKQT